MSEGMLCLGCGNRVLPHQLCKNGFCAACYYVAVGAEPKIKMRIAKGAEAAVLDDAVDAPGHYKQHPSGVECIAIAEHLGFCLGNAVKYIWRAGLKDDDKLTDLKKARWYIEREIARLS